MFFRFHFVIFSFLIEIITMKKNIIFSCLIALTAFACSNNKLVGIILEHDIIEEYNFNDCLSNVDYKLDDILDSMRIISLESNDISLIGNTYKLIVTDKRIYIYDDYQEYGLIIFDSNGKFLKRIERGNGPGEYQRILSIAFDKYQQELLILTNPYLLKYDADGNYISTIELDYPTDNIVGCTQDKYLFSKVYGHQSKDNGDIDSYSLLVADKNGSLLQMLMPYNNTIIPMSTGSCVYDDKISIGLSHCDSIYYFDNDSLFHYRNLDFSSKKLDISQFTTYQDYIQSYLTKIESDRLFFNGTFFENKSHFILPLNMGRTSYLIFVDKESGKTHSGKLQFYDNTSAIPILAPMGVSDSWFYALGNPADYKHGSLSNPKYLSKEDVAKLESLTPDDNPYIMFYKLKRFE